MFIICQWAIRCLLANFPPTDRSVEESCSPQLPKHQWRLFFSNTIKKCIPDSAENLYVDLGDHMVNTVVMHISMLYGSRCLNKNEEVRMSYKTVWWYLKHYELVKKMIESVLCHLENRRWLSLYCAIWKIEIDSATNALECIVQVQFCWFFFFFSFIPR